MAFRSLYSPTAPPNIQTAKLSAVGLDELLGALFTAEELGAAKPDPRTYLTVCAELGVTPASTAHVGDLYDLDVTAPRAAGLHAVYLDRQSAGPLEDHTESRHCDSFPTSCIANEADSDGHDPIPSVTRSPSQRTRLSPDRTCYRLCRLSNQRRPT
ncbi:HAD family hydrolase [Jatrophihabitans lederbergiae]|uniref:HAD family hydrolase n=1 Tax=Jatrophihabitans lederbergiae TaxID=3075547 RepID=UPI0037C04E9C